jgi:methylenetetrahydrofolate dehydrogenase (NADP+)/methenyltetrahydrofolate cyclohydrolase
MNASSPFLLDGRKASQDLIESLQKKVADLKNIHQRPPGLKVIQVGNDPASEAYIRQKQKAASLANFHFVHEHLSRDSSFEDILKVIQETSEDSDFDGMILQLPLDSSQKFSAEQVQTLVESIPPGKDADGLHSFNQGKLFTGESLPTHWTHPIPATPFGIFRLLDFYNISVSAKDLTVIGKSRLVGLPAAVIAAHLGATVTICNRLTQDLASKTKLAEILIVAAGKKHLVTAAHVRPGVTIIDVGIHRQEDGKLTGDTASDAFAKSGAYSPVPGGVGPMTVACLMENTYRLRLKHQNMNRAFK